MRNPADFLGRLGGIVLAAQTCREHSSVSGFRKDESTQPEFTKNRTRTLVTGKAPKRDYHGRSVLVGGKINLIVGPSAGPGGKRLRLSQDLGSLNVSGQGENH